MSYASGRGHAVVNPNNPEAFAVCDRCGHWYPHAQLSWQHEYAGPKLVNLRLLVCPRCLDKPAEFLRSIILPPDPLPVKNPRPEFFSADEGAPPANIPVYRLVGD